MKLKYLAGMTQKAGITFAVVQVNKNVLDIPGRAMDTMTALKPEFPDMAIVLVARNNKGIPVFFGRPDIVNGLGEEALRDVEWSERTLEAPDREADK